MEIVVAVLCLSVVICTPTHARCSSSWCFGGQSLPADTNKQPLPIVDLIKQFGYPVESHEVETEDGYLLTYHRIPRGKNARRDAPLGSPVMLQHGLLGASSVWLLSEQSLGYTLADAGFDVWLANARGNTFSRKHVTLDPDKDRRDFWDFSWHEIGYYDVPAGIDYILRVRERKKLFYIGHSQGTTVYFVLGASKPEYMDKIQAAVMLAPVAYPWNVRSPLANFFGRFTESVRLVVAATGSYEVSPYTNFVLWIDRRICSDPRLDFVCKEMYGYFAGYEKGLKRVDLSRVLEYIPAGAAYKQFRHYKQIAEKGKNFQQYDYGFLRNFMKYNSFHPPIYNLSTVDAPLYAYYATNDWQAVPTDVFHLVEELPNVKRLIKVEDDQFNHLDFIWANDAKTLVYNNIVSILQGY